MHENFEPFREDPILLIKETAAVFEDKLTAYAQTLSSLVNKNGNLISIERTGRNPLLLGWMWALSDNGMGPNDSYYHEITCQESSKESTFQAMVFEHFDIVDREDIYNAFCNTFVRYIDVQEPQWSGWEASVMLQNSIGELIEGYDVFNPKDDDFKFGHFSVWTSEYDSEGLLVNIQRVDMGLNNLENHFLRDKEGIVAELRKVVKEYLTVNQGYRVFKLKYEDGKAVKAGEVKQSDL